MSDSAQKAKSWIGIFFLVWPIARIVAGAFGVPLPELPVPTDWIAGVSQVAGTYMVATTPSLKKEK